MKINLIKYYDVESKKVEYALIKDTDETKYVDKRIIRTFNNEIEEFVNFILEKDGKDSNIGNKIYLFLKSPNIDDVTKERITEIFKDKSYYKEKI
jgi:hypothetical protein